MEIYMMQHGDALPKDKDPERGLSPEGENQIRLSAKALKRLQVHFDLIISSPKKRARQTAQIVARELGYPEDRIEVTETLEPLSPAIEAVSYLKSFAAKEHILLAGHLPSLAEIASELMSETHISIRFEMGGLCRIDVEKLPTHEGKLRWYLTPEHLRLVAQLPPETH